MTTNTDLVRRPAPVTVLVGEGPHVVCPVCGKQIQFVTTKNLKQMPCEMELRQGDGVRTLIDHAGKTHRKAGHDVHGFEPHFGYCSKHQRRA